MSVLILARDLAPTADRMVTALDERGAEVVRAVIWRSIDVVAGQRRVAE